jgi:rhamnose utilization protein RhaD (predicted bifunctional aldolase and dehydrogenase)
VQSLWSDTVADKFEGDLAQRVYTSNLLGQDDTLVLHGGGNTSVKTEVNGEAILYVKGSGWDLVSIKAEGFAPVRMQTLLAMAQVDAMSDTEMVAQQRAAMIDAQAPNPSVEAILHAIIPYKFVDHTHADAIVTISNSAQGKAKIATLFPGFLIIDYVMPGFILAKEIVRQTQGFDWSTCEGIILHNHGIFTFSDDAKIAYEKMIDTVTKAERFLANHAPVVIQEAKQSSYDVTPLQRAIADAKGAEVVALVDQSPLAQTYASQPNLADTATRGVLTPEHIIRTKRIPLVLQPEADIAQSLARYQSAYQDYFARYASDEQIMLNSAPNYAIIEGVGAVYFGKTMKEASIIQDVVRHTMQAVMRADQLGGYESISEPDSFDMEYWELEQAKLKKVGA